MNTNDTPTPRTDANVIKDKMIIDELGLADIVEARFARDLERELARAEEIIRECDIGFADIARWDQQIQDGLKDKLEAVMMWRGCIALAKEHLAKIAAYRSRKP